MTSWREYPFGNFDVYTFIKTHFNFKQFILHQRKYNVDEV